MRHVLIQIMALLICFKVAVAHEVPSPAIDTTQKLLTEVQMLRKILQSSFAASQKSIVLMNIIVEKERTRRDFVDRLQRARDEQADNISTITENNSKLANETNSDERKTLEDLNRSLEARNRLLDSRIPNLETELSHLDTVQKKFQDSLEDILRFEVK